MDMMPTSTPTPTTTTTPKSPEPESETPTRIQPAKPISFSNGIIKRHHHHPLLFTYKECLKNHAAALGGHALDGCGEFMPSPSSISSDPTSLKCAACGCHRNFHRRDPDDSTPSSAIPPPLTAIEYHPHHRHHPPPPPPPPGHSRSPNSSSPPPISSSYMLLALSGTNNNAGNNNLPFSDLNFSGNNLSTHHHHHHAPGSRKRFRTKFSQFQKDKMQEFAERVGWKMQKRDEDDIRDFCRQIGVDRGVLKVWMHNNKNTFNRRENLFSVGGTEIPKIAGDDTTNDDYNRDEASGGGGGRGLGHDLHQSVSSGGGGGFDSDSGGGGGGANGGNANGSSSS